MNNSKKWVRALALFMAAVMLLGLVVSLIPVQASAKSSSVLKEELDQLEADKDAIQAQMQELEGQLSDNLSEIKDIVARKSNIDQQVGLLYAQVYNINQQISTYSLLIADKQDELDAAQARLDLLNEQNRARIRTMEAQGPLSYWQVLFNATSFSDLLDRLNMVQEIAAEDERRLNEMSQVAQTVAAAKDALAVEKQSLELSRAELDVTMAELDEKRIEADALITELLSREDELDALLEDFEEQERQALADIAQKEKEYEDAKYEEWLATSEPETTAPPVTNPGGGGSGGGGSNVSNSGWIIPCDYSYVSSPFGPREPPTAGASSYHAGVDLAAPKGTPIYASRGGTVTTATYGSAAGYYVSINHGDGFSSSYLHMTHYVVKSGQSVSQGQLIGYVGSTGVSTGPHLHFSIYKNGVAVNPAHYIPI